MANSALTTRRSLLKAAVAAPLITAPAALASASPAPGAAAHDFDANAYYAFLWFEMELLEQHIGCDRLDRRPLEAGRERSDAFLAASNIDDRRRWMGQCYQRSLSGR